MLLAALVTVWAPAGEVGAWRAYEEVFDLARIGGTVYAATDGGLLREAGTAWVPVNSPTMVREIESTVPLVIRLADGRSFQQQGSAWRGVAFDHPRLRTVTEGQTVTGPAEWIAPVFAPPCPPASPYCATLDHGTLLAGTANGLYTWSGGRWLRQTLPSDLPLPRPNGIGEVSGTYVIGGLGGLFIGQPGSWKLASASAVRQIAQVGSEVWVVYGSGGVDKLLPSEDKLYPDVFNGSAKRPWSSCVAQVDGELDFGGQGGWLQHGSALTEKYPSELDGDVVMAIDGSGTTRWIGTQKSGLLRYEQGATHRWNPGNGLTDPWVTALCLDPPNGLIVGTATQGLFQVQGAQIKPLQGPSNRITKLALWQGQLVVGGMDGAWIRSATRWQELPTGGEETTALTSLDDGRLAIATATGVHFIR